MPEALVGISIPIAFVIAPPIFLAPSMPDRSERSGFSAAIRSIISDGLSGLLPPPSVIFAPPLTTAIETSMAMPTLRAVAMFSVISARRFSSVSPVFFSSAEWSATRFCCTPSQAADISFCAPVSSFDASVTCSAACGGVTRLTPLLSWARWPISCASSRLLTTAAESACGEFTPSICCIASSRASDTNIWFARGTPAL